jgi:anthranilate synthase component II
MISAKSALYSGLFCLLPYTNVMQRILVFDNYDSFTYNLVHLVEKVAPDAQVDVVRNDQFVLENGEQYDRIILSPGPGIPEEAGALLALIRRYRGKKPIFGVCLGQQAIAVAAGGKLINLDEVYHGIATRMRVTSQDSALFRSLETGFFAGRYHSWIVEEESLPKEFAVTARDEKGNIMAIENAAEKIYGVQFHPESIMTDCGDQIMYNFLNSPL